MPAPSLLPRRRVFGDKLVSHEDKGWLDRQLAELCRAEFPQELCKQARGGFRRRQSPGWKPQGRSCCSMPSKPDR